MLVGVVGVGTLPGCAGPWPARGRSAEHTSGGAIVLRVEADWDDVEASVLTAASQSGCAMERFAIEEQGDGRQEAWVGEVISVHDDRAEVRVERETAESEIESPIVLRIEPNAASDRGVLAAFGERVVRRLRQLRGVRTAPLDGPER
jgi:hypothetical protein